MKNHVYEIGKALVRIKGKHVDIKPYAPAISPALRLFNFLDCSFRFSCNATLCFSGAGNRRETMIWKCTFLYTMQFAM